MGSVLAVSASGKGLDYLRALLTPLFDAVAIAADRRQALHLSCEAEYDLIVINAPPDSRDSILLAGELIEETTSAILLLVKEDTDTDLVETSEKIGVLVLHKPLTKPVFLQAVRLALASRRRMLGLKNENKLLQNQIEEIKLVDRAKCTLIQYLGLSEPLAHRYIEKQAMDRRISRVEVAQGILKTYET